MSRTQTQSQDGIRPPLRIAFAWNYREWGGAQMYFIGIARQLRGKADSVFFVPEGTSESFLRLCKDEQLDVRFLKRSVTIDSPGSVTGKLRRHVSKILSEIELVRDLTRGRFDLVHTDLGPWQSLIAMILISINTPLVYTVHNRLPEVSSLRRLSWRLKFFVASRFRGMRAFASNRDAKNSLEVIAPKRLTEETEVTYTNISREELDSVQIDTGSRTAFRARFNVGSDETAVVCIGQFIDRKGRWDFLAAAKMLVAAGSPAKFFWITNSDVGAAERAQVEDYGLGDSFRLLKMGDQLETRQEMLAFVGSCDIFVLPSHVEGLPIALLEAMYLRLPAVSTRVNGIPEAIEEGKTGLLVEAGDPRDLATKIDALVSDDGLRISLARAGKERVANNFVEDQVAEVAYRAYCGAIASARGGRTE